MRALMTPATTAIIKPPIPPPRAFRPIEVSTTLMRAFSRVGSQLFRMFAQIRQKITPFFLSPFGGPTIRRRILAEYIRQRSRRAFVYRNPILLNRGDGNAEPGGKFLIGCSSQSGVQQLLLGNAKAAMRRRVLEKRSHPCAGPPRL